MIKDLNTKQAELAIYMSELSEEAYAASWMTNLEYNLWQIMKREISNYGRLNANEEIIEKLEKLSNEIKGWIYFDDKTEETFVNFNDWKNRIKDYH